MEKTTALVGLLLVAGLATAVLSSDDLGWNGDPVSTDSEDPNGASAPQSVTVEVGRTTPIAYAVIEKAENASLSFEYQIGDDDDLAAVWFLQTASDAPGFLGLGNGFANPVAQGIVVNQRVDARTATPQLDADDTFSPLIIEDLTVESADERIAVGLAVQSDVSGTAEFEWSHNATVQIHTDTREPILLETSELDADIAVTGRYGPTIVPDARASLDLSGFWLGQAWFVLPSGELEYCVDDPEDCWTETGGIVSCRSPNLSGPTDVSLSMQSREGSLFSFAAIPHVFETNTPTGLVCDRADPEGANLGRKVGP